MLGRRYSWGGTPSGGTVYREATEREGNQTTLPAVGDVYWCNQLSPESRYRRQRGSGQNIQEMLINLVQEKDGISEVLQPVKRSSRPVSKCGSDKLFRSNMCSKSKDFQAYRSQNKKNRNGRSHSQVKNNHCQPSNSVKLVSLNVINKRKKKTARLNYPSTGLKENATKYASSMKNEICKERNGKVDHNSGKVILTEFVPPVTSSPKKKFTEKDIAVGIFPDSVTRTGFFSDFNEALKPTESQSSTESDTENGGKLNDAKQGYIDNSCLIANLPENPQDDAPSKVGDMSENWTRIEQTQGGSNLSHHMKKDITGGFRTYSQPLGAATDTQPPKLRRQTSKSGYKKPLMNGPQTYSSVIKTDLKRNANFVTGFRRSRSTSITLQSDITLLPDMKNVVECDLVLNDDGRHWQRNWKKTTTRRHLLRKLTLPIPLPIGQRSLALAVEEHNRATPSQTCEPVVISANGKTLIPVLQRQVTQTEERSKSAEILRSVRKATELVEVMTSNKCVTEIQEKLEEESAEACSWSVLEAGNKELPKQLLRLLLHALQCLSVQCHVKECIQTKRVLSHLSICMKINCLLPFCAPASWLLDHWHSCRVSCCSLCSPNRPPDTSCLLNSNHINNFPLSNGPVFASAINSAAFSVSKNAINNRIFSYSSQSNGYHIQANNHLSLDLQATGIDPTVLDLSACYDIPTFLASETMTASSLLAASTPAVPAASDMAHQARHFPTATTRISQSLVQLDDLDVPDNKTQTDCDAEYSGSELAMELGYDWEYDLSAKFLLSGDLVDALDDPWPAPEHPPLAPGHERRIKNALKRSRLTLGRTPSLPPNNPWKVFPDDANLDSGFPSYSMGIELTTWGAGTTTGNTWNRLTGINSVFTKDVKTKSNQASSFPGIGELPDQLRSATGSQDGEVAGTRRPRPSTLPLAKPRSSSPSSSPPQFLNNRESTVDVLQSLEPCVKSTSATELFDLMAAVHLYTAKMKMGADYTALRDYFSPNQLYQPRYVDTQCLM